MVLLAAVLSFRLAFTLFFVQHTDLVGDEAYYWDWGRQLDWGYYSKPPLIGWLMAGISWVSGGGSELAIRLTSLIIGTASLAVLHALTRRLFGPRAAFWSVVLALLTPANAALNLFMTIDSPLILCWTGALWLFWRATESPERISRWLVLGVVMGIGVLTKQMMLVFPLLMGIWALSGPTQRTLLRRPGFWLACWIAVGALTPVLWWNQQHDWITLEHTKHHFNADARTLSDHVTEFIQFPLTQLLLYSPLIWISMLGVGWWVLRQGRAAPEPARFLVLFSAAPLVVFFLLALRQEVNPNWPAVFYLGLVALTAGWFGSGMLSQPSRVWKRWVVGFGIGFTALAYLLPVVVEIAGWQGRKPFDVAKDLRGWSEAGRQAGELLDACPRPERTLVVVLGHRYHAAHMAFEMPQRPRVYRWERDGAVMSQYEVWGPPTGKEGWDVLVIYPDPDNGRPRGALTKYFSQHFASAEPFGEIDVKIGDSRRYTAQVIFCREMKQWPPSIPQQQAAASENFSERKDQHGDLGS